MSPKEEKKDKAEEDDKEGSKQAKQEKERKQILANVTQSNLLSGGVDYDNIGILKAETKEQLRKFAALGEDKELLKILDKDANVETPFQRIIEAGKDAECDKAIQYLQKYLLKYAHKTPYARIGGDDGMRLSRAAFAVMIKYGDLADDFDNFVDEMQMADESDVAAIFKTIETDFSNILSRWQSASRMRTWIQEKKLEYNEKHEADLIAKLKQEKRDAYKKKKEEEEKAKAEAEAKESEDKKDDEEKKESEGDKDAKSTTEDAQIDTSAKKEDGEKKGDDEKKEGDQEDDKKKEEEEDEEAKANKLTDEEKQKCNDEAFELSNKDLQKAYAKLIEKAVFLTKLNVPLRFKKSKKSGLAEDALSMTRTKSLIETADGKVTRQATQVGEGHLSWENRLKKWKDYQRSQGTIVTNQERKNVIWNSGVTSVLALLQTEIQSDKLQDFSEKIMLDGAKRVAGLKLLKELTTGDMPKSHLAAGVAWFTTGLRGGVNKLTHYLDDVQGQGLALESLSRQYFFAVLSNVVMRLKESKDEDEVRHLIDALKWKYAASDHEFLVSLNVFAVLHRGNGEWENMIRKSWGKSAGGALLKKEEEQSIQQTAYNVFEMIFMQVASRITESDLGQDLHLKKGGMSAAPKMQKSKSVVDEAVSERLIGQAFDVIFRELARYVKLLAAFEGLDWEAFARKRNEDRRNGDEIESLRQTEQETLLDQIEDELEKEEEAEEESESKKDEEEKADDEDKPAEEKKEEGDAAATEEKKEAEAELTEEQKKEQEEKRKEEEEKKKAEEDDRRKKIDEGIIED